MMTQGKSVFEMTEDELNKQGILVQIQALEDELKEYDYIGVKIAMGVAAKKEYATEIAYTETLRAKINELESQLDG